MAIKPVTDTGIKGFLLWFKQNQPNVYTKIAPVLPKAVPAAFSNYNKGGALLAGLSHTEAVEKLNRIYSGNYSKRERQGMSDYYSPIYVTAPSTAGGVYVNYTATLTNPVSSSVTNDLLTQPTPTVDVASAANSGVSSTSTGAQIAAVINAASAGALTASQIATQQKVLNVQLQRAAAGLPPLSTSLNSLGVPTIGSSISSTGWILLAALAGGALLLVK